MAAFRRRKLRFGLFTSYRPLLWIVGALLVGALLFHLGCQHSAPPVEQPIESGAPTVRVRLVADATVVKLTATAKGSHVIVRGATGQPVVMPLLPRMPIAISSNPIGWHVGAADFGRGELTIECDPPGSVSIEGRAYRGTYHLVAAKGAAFDVINHVLVDEYLKGVLAAELFPDFHPEAYKAQAVVARTYAIYVSRTAGESRHWDLNSDVRSQMYGGVKAESAKSIAAVDATAGMVLAYGPKGQAKIFKAYYSSCCGGATQTAQEAFGEAAFEPFTERSSGRRCDVSAGRYHARFDWGPVVVTRAELTRRIKLWGRHEGHALKAIDGIRRVDVFRSNAAGRPTNFAIEDSRGAKYVITGEQLRLAVNTDAPEASRLPSGFVTPVLDGANMRFQDGHGFGHGVGMCQWCAQAQAVQGDTYDKIVLGAYQGAVLVKGY